MRGRGKRETLIKNLEGKASSGKEENLWFVFPRKIV